MNILISLDDSSDHFRIYTSSDMKLITKVFPDKFQHAIYPVHILNIAVSDIE